MVIRCGEIEECRQRDGWVTYGLQASRLQQIRKKSIILCAIMLDVRLGRSTDEIQLNLAPLCPHPCPVVQASYSFSQARQHLKAK